MTIPDAAALSGAIGVVVAGFVATMIFIEIAIARRRSILQLNIGYLRPARFNRIDKKAA